MLLQPPQTDKVHEEESGLTGVALPVQLFTIKVFTSVGIAPPPAVPPSSSLQRKLSPSWCTQIDIKVGLSLVTHSVSCCWFYRSHTADSLFVNQANNLWPTRANRREGKTLCFQLSYKSEAMFVHGIDFIPNCCCSSQQTFAYFPNIVPQ